MAKPPKHSGLVPQVIALVPDAGLRQDYDDKTLPLKNFSRLVNCTLDKVGRFMKMPGVKDLPRDIAGGGSLSSSQGLATFRDELLQFSENHVYSFNESADNWVSRGEVSFVGTASQQLVRNSQQQTVPDASFAAGSTVIAWNDTSGGVMARVVDRETGLVVVSDTTLRAGSTRPKVVSQLNNTFIFYAAGTNLYARKYDRGITSTAFGAEVLIASDLNGTNFLYDVCPFLNAIGLTYRTNGGQIKFAYVTTALAVGSPLNGFPSPTTLAEDAENSLTCWPNGTQTLLVMWHNAANGTRVTARKAVDLTQSFAPVTVRAAGTTSRNVTGIVYSGTTSRMFYEVSGTSPQFAVVYTRTVDVAGVLGTETVVRRSVGLNSKPFVRTDGVYVQAALDTPLQATAYLLRHDGFIAARMNYATSGGLTELSVLPEVMNPETDVYVLPGTIKARFITEGNTTFSRTGLIQYTHDFGVRTAPPIVSTDNALFLLGGMAQVYDGVSFTELGFDMYPEGITHSQSAGAITVGSYQWAFLWEWFDNQGQIHRSAPSVPVEITIVGTQRVTFAIPTLRLTAKQGARTAPVLAAYRTLEIGANGGDVFYRVSSRTVAGGVNGLFLNDPTVDTITFVDNLTDASIQSNELLYTNGGILENFPPEPCSAGVTYKNRLFVNTTDGSGFTYYSKATAPGEAPSFNQALQLATDPEGGDVTSFGVLDDKLVLQKLVTNWASVGEPASNTGLNGSLTAPERIATSTGCHLPRTVVRSEIGLWYHSEKGIFLLDRGLNEQNIAKPVVDEQVATPSAAILLTDKNQVRFYHTDGTCLVYDTYYKTWSTFARREAVDAVVWQGHPAIAQSDGTVRIEDGSFPFTDRGVFYGMRIDTGWISLAGVQGFQRVWRILTLGTYKSPHKLLLRVATNFSEVWKQVAYADPQVGLNTTAYGESTPYGDEDVYGGGADPIGLDEVYQARFHVEPQKCQAIKISIEDLRTEEAPGESFQLNAISLVVGLKRGGFKPHAKRSFGGE